MLSCVRREESSEQLKGACLYADIRNECKSCLMSVCMLLSISWVWRLEDGTNNKFWGNDAASTPALIAWYLTQLVVVNDPLPILYLSRVCALFRTLHNHEYLFRLIMHLHHERWKRLYIILLVSLSVVAHHLFFVLSMTIMDLEKVRLLPPDVHRFDHDYTSAISKDILKEVLNEVLMHGKALLLATAGAGQWPDKDAGRGKQAATTLNNTRLACLGLWKLSPPVSTAGFCTWHNMKRFVAKTDICLARCYWHAPLKLQGADDARASPHLSASSAYRRKKITWS